MGVGQIFEVAHAAHPSWADELGVDTEFGEFFLTFCRQVIGFLFILMRVATREDLYAVGRHRGCFGRPYVFVGFVVVGIFVFRIIMFGGSIVGVCGRIVFGLSCCFVGLACSFVGLACSFAGFSRFAGHGLIDNFLDDAVLDNAHFAFARSLCADVLGERRLCHCAKRDGENGKQDEGEFFHV